VQYAEMVAESLEDGAIPLICEQQFSRSAPESPA